jgi:hypothetical protein
MPLTIVQCSATLRVIPFHGLLRRTYRLRRSQFNDGDWPGSDVALIFDVEAQRDELSGFGSIEQHPSSQGAGVLSPTTSGRGADHRPGESRSKVGVGGDCAVGDILKLTTAHVICSEELIHNRNLIVWTPAHVRSTEHYLGSKQRIRCAVNDCIGIKPSKAQWSTDRSNAAMDPYPAAGESAASPVLVLSSEPALVKTSYCRCGTSSNGLTAVA